MLIKFASAYLMLGAALVQSSFSQPSCIRPESPPPLPVYTASGAWSLDGDELLLADSQTKQILRYFPLGKFGGSITDSLFPMLQGQKANRIISTHSGLLIEIKGGRILRISSNRSYPSGLQERSVKVKDVGEIAGFQQFDAIGNDIVAITDIKDNQNNWKSSLIRLTFGSTTAFSTLVEKLDKKKDSSLFYNLGLPYLAAVEGKNEAIFLFEFNGDSPELFRVAPKRSQERIEFSGGFAPNPALPPASKLAKSTRDFFFRDVFRAIEGREFPVGLYSWEGNIYILKREPAADGSGSFTILKLDPGKTTGKISVEKPTLPSMQLKFDDVAHITLVPGPHYWAVVEKGPVNGFARQVPKNLAFIPSSYFRGAMKPSVDCRR